MGIIRSHLAQMVASLFSSVNSSLFIASTYDTNHSVTRTHVFTKTKRPHTCGLLTNQHILAKRSGVRKTGTPRKVK